MREYPDLALRNPTVDATVVIPTVDNFDSVISCIESLRKFSPGRNVEYVVVDDGSDDSYFDKLMMHQVKYNYSIRRQWQNLGISAAINLGWRHANGRILINSNNDVQVTGPWLEPFEALFNRDQAIGAIGAKLLYPDGSPQHFGCYKIPRKLDFPHTVDPSFENSTRYVWRTTGAFFAVRRECAVQIGGFSVAYATAWEDVDYCLELWRKNWRVAYCSDVVAKHVEGQTRGRTAVEKCDRPSIWSHRECSSENYFKRKWSRLVTVEDFMLTKDVKVC